MKRFTLIQVLIVWLISTTSIMLNAQTWRKIQVFTHPEECQSYHPAEGPTCISNGIALIGSQYSSCDLNGQNFIEAAGAAYFHVLQPTGLWSQTQEIIASDRGYLDSFGYSVGIDFDCSIIGAPNKQKFDIATGSMINVGACYFFSKGSNGIWNQQQEIMASDAIADDNFGYSVFIMGDYAFIGDPGPLDNNVQFSHIGKVYIFKKDPLGSWSEFQIITPPIGSENKGFGFSISASGDFVFIGTPGPNNQDNIVGQVNVYKIDLSGNWSYFQTIADPTGNQSGGFGNSISLFGDEALIGAPWINLGSILFYKYNPNIGWYLETEFDNHDSNNIGFGWSVSLSNDHAAIGNEAGIYGIPGKVSVFKKDVNGNWLPDPDIIEGDALSSSTFGLFVCLSDNYLFTDGRSIDNQGYTYIYRLCNDLEANAGNSQQICKGQFVTLGGDSQNPTAQGGIPPYTYAWKTHIPSNWSSNIENPVVQPDQTTEYDLRVTDLGGNGITASSNVTIRVENCPYSYPITFNENLQQSAVSTNTQGDVVLIGKYYNSQIIFEDNLNVKNTITDYEPSTYERMFIGKFTKTGVSQWAHSISSQCLGGDTKYKKLILDDINNTYLLLESISQFFLEDGTKYSGNYSNNNMSIIKFDQYGNIVWVKIFELPISGLKDPAISYSDEAIYFQAFTCQSSVTFFGIPVNYGYFVAKILNSGALDGNVEWIKQNPNWCEYGKITFANNYLLVHHINGITLVNPNGTIFKECSITQVNIPQYIYYFDYGGQNMFYVLSKINACNGYSGLSCSLTGLEAITSNNGTISFSTKNCELGSCTWPSFAPENNYAYLLYEDPQNLSLNNRLEKFEMESGTTSPPIWSDNFPTNDFFSLAVNANQTFGYYFHFYNSNSISILSQFDKNSGSYNCSSIKELQDSVTFFAKSKYDWTFFPNPTTDFLNILYSGGEEIKQVQFEVYNSIGVLLYAYLPGNIFDPKTVINTSSLPSGIYFVRILSNGKILKSEKIVKY